MPLNKSVGNMYDFVTHTWNPIRGNCIHDCSYCYEKKFKLGELRLIELITNLGNYKFIFVGSSTDIFANNVHEVWINAVLHHCRGFPANRYLFQTKNPKRYLGFIKKFPEKTILGTTIETNRSTANISKAPSTCERAYAMQHIQLDKLDKEVTIEPILDFDLYNLVSMIEDIKPKFVAIGADSKGHNLQEPTADKVRSLIWRLNEFTKVKVKRNLGRILK